MSGFAPGDDLVAQRFPLEWARANDPLLRNRSKARNNLRRRYRETVAQEEWRAANPSAKCADCVHSSSRAIILRGALTCDLDSDFGGFSVIQPDSWCTRFQARVAA